MMTRDIAAKGLLRKLGGISILEADDRAAIEALSMRLVSYGPRHSLVREGSLPTACCLLVDGYAARSKLTAEGRKQIVSFHVSGDLLDLQHLFLERADHDVRTITSARVAWIPMSELRALMTARPAIAMVFWRDAMIEASITREWVLNVGRRDAKTRIAHMLCEFVVRSEAAGLGTPERMCLPFTQEDISDATGLTSVHVNRMLRSLDADGLIVRKDRFIEVKDWEGFRRAAGFNDAYLHLAA